MSDKPTLAQLRGLVADVVSERDFAVPIAAKALAFAVEMLEPMECGHPRNMEDRSVETGVAFCTVCRNVEMLRDALTGEEHYKATSAAFRAMLARVRDVLRAEIAMPHACSDCGWNTGGVPKGLHNFGCRVANAVDEARNLLDETP